MHPYSPNHNRPSGPFTSKYKELQQKGKRQSLIIKQLFNNPDMPKTPAQSVKECPNSIKTVKNLHRKPHRLQIGNQCQMQRKKISQEQHDFLLNNNNEGRFNERWNIKEFGQEYQQDKSIQFLKSDQYRRYLQSITKIKFQEDNRQLKNHRNQLQKNQKADHQSIERPNFNQRKNQWNSKEVNYKNSLSLRKNRDRIKTQHNNYNYENLDVHKERQIDKEYINNPNPIIKSLNCQRYTYEIQEEDQFKNGHVEKMKKAEIKQPYKIKERYIQRDIQRDRQKDRNRQRDRENEKANYLDVDFQFNKIKDQDQVKKKQLSVFRCVEICINQPKPQSPSSRQAKVKKYGQTKSKSKLQTNKATNVIQKLENKKTRQKNQKVQQNEVKLKEVTNNLNYKKKVPQQLTFSVENQVQTDLKGSQQDFQQQQENKLLINFKLSSSTGHLVRHNNQIQQQRTQLREMKPSNRQHEENTQNYKIQYKLSSPFFRHSKLPKGSDQLSSKQNRYGQRSPLNAANRQKHKHQRVYVGNNEHLYHMNNIVDFMKKSPYNHTTSHEMASSTQRQTLVYHRHSPPPHHLALPSHKLQPEYCKGKQKTQYYNRDAPSSKQSYFYRQPYLIPREKQRKKISLITKSQIILPK